MQDKDFFVLFLSTGGRLRLLRNGSGVRKRSALCNNTSQVSRDNSQYGGKGSNLMCDKHLLRFLVSLVPFCSFALFSSSVLRSLPGHAQTRTSKLLRPKTRPLGENGEKRVRKSRQAYNRDTFNSYILCKHYIKVVALTLRSPGSVWWVWAGGSCLPCRSCCTWIWAEWWLFPSPAETEEIAHFLSHTSVHLWSVNFQTESGICTCGGS